VEADRVMFSIIIPCYNAEKYLPDTLQCLDKQTFRDFEVIVVDDNSTDGSFEIAQTLIKKYRLVGSAHRKPQLLSKGVSSTRNYGISLARGEWIALLDSDDLFRVNKLNVIHQCIDHHPQVDFIHHPVFNFEENAQVDILADYPKALKPTESIYDLNFVVTSSVVVRKSVLAEFNFFEEGLNGVEDYHLWLKIFSAKSVLFVPEILGFYRMRSTSLMGGRTLQYYVNQNTRLLREINFLDHEKFKQVENYFIFNLMSYYSNISISKHGYFSLVKGCVLLMVKGYPVFGISLFFTKTKNHSLFKLFGRK
jgi:glycosyltransferase involved in cell wall biosynthesis